MRAQHGSHESTLAIPGPIPGTVSSTALPEGYTLEKCLQSGSRGEVFAATRDSDGLAVVLKLYHRKSLADRTAAARRERESLAASAGRGVPRAFDLLLDRDPPVLVLERMPGLSLGSWLSVRRPQMLEFLGIAIQLAEILTRVHAARLIHRDITPWNVMIDPATRDACLLDFELARRLGAAQTETSPQEGAEGTLLYMAPEQTGRMNRSCDFRSDLYGMGATLYHTLVGRPPFDATDPLELIHAHIARLPPLPVEVRPEIPEALSRLLIKLLRKDPEDRYQSAATLLTDLQECRRQLAESGQIDPSFVLGSTEAPDHPVFPQRLYGRDESMARLRSIFADSAQGQSRILLLDGKAGAGKSVLVDQLRAPVAECGGYLAVAKFDQYRESPYSGWTAVLESLSHQLLTESDSRLTRWKEELRGGMRNIAQALVNLAPHLGFVLGELPPLPALGPRETQARVALALERFVTAFGAPEHPLVVFFDDLQWSDSASLQLLEDLAVSRPSGALLLICSYRSDELEDEHAVKGMLARWRTRDVAFERIELAPLSDADATAMLADALGRTPEDTRSLAELAGRRTGNNPLLIRQFTEHLHDQGMLRHQSGVGWVWDTAQVTSATLPDGAVALMTAKIQKLDPAIRDALRYASCVGEEFDIDLLAELSRGDRGPLMRSLDTLCDEGFIAPCPSGFRFAHHRIREAVHSLLSESERAQLHYQTGCLLLSRIPEAQRVQHAAKITEHLNRGLAHVTEDLRLPLIRLNLAAGKSALASGAAAAAASHLSVGLELFRDEDWASQHAAGMNLHLLMAESAFQTRDFDESLRWLAALDSRVSSRSEIAQLAVKRIQVLTFQQSPESCVRQSLDILHRLGVRWPLHPSWLRVKLTMNAVAWMLRLRGYGDRFEQAQALDPERIAPALVTSQAGAVMMRFDVRLVMLASSRSVHQFISLGYTKDRKPAYSLSAFSAYYYLLTGNARASQQIATAALRWTERIPDPLLGPRAEVNLRGILYPWLMRRRQAVSPLERIAEAAHEIGDIQFSYYARFLMGISLALGGDPVAQCEQTLQELDEAIQRSRVTYLPPAKSLEAYRLLHTPDVEIADGTQTEGKSSLADVGEPYVRTLRMMALCLHGRYADAFAESEAMGERIFLVSPLVHIADFHLYRGLAASALASQTKGKERRAYTSVLRDCLQRLSRWALSGPDFVHMAMLLEAERTRLRGKLPRARARYDQAAQRARQQEFPHHAAMAHERRATLLAEHRRETEAASSLAQAGAIYRDWGAIAVADAIEKRRQVLAVT